MGEENATDITAAAMLRMIAYAVDEGQGEEVPACLRAIAAMLDGDGR